jgi:hypothetical protein
MVACCAFAARLAAPMVACAALVSASSDCSAVSAWSKVPFGAAALERERRGPLSLA